MIHKFIGAVMALFLAIILLYIGVKLLLEIWWALLLLIIVVIVIIISIRVWKNRNRW